MLGVNNPVVMMKRKGQSKRGEKKDVKVTYISSPMKVKTSVSNFRALVQELTGQASNVAEMSVEPDYYYSDGARDDGVQKGTDIQQFSRTSDTYFHEPTTWFKSQDDHYSLLHSWSSSSMEPLNEKLQYELLSFDMVL